MLDTIISSLATVARSAGVGVATLWTRARELSCSCSYASASSAKSRSPRIRWDDYFLGLAFLASRRSPDESTKHGIIITDKDNRIIATGYNGFVRGVDDSGMPQTRPEKYDFIIHSEPNALINMVGKIEAGAKAYITGFPCVQCFSLMLQAGLRDFYLADRRGYTNPPLSQGDNVARLCREVGATLRIVKPDLNWLVDEDFIDELKELGFIEKTSLIIHDVEGGYIDVAESQTLAGWTCEESGCTNDSTRHMFHCSAFVCGEHCRDWENSRPHGWNTYEPSKTVLKAEK